MSPKQKKLAAKAPPPNVINEKDFAVLRAEKAKGRGMGLQDEKVKPGKVMKANEGMSIKERVAPTRVKEKIKKAYELTKHDSYAKSGVSAKGRAKIYLSKIKKGEVPGFPSRDKVKGMYRDMEKVKPIKAVLGIAAMGALGAKYLKDKNKKALALPGVGAAALMAKKKKEILGKKRGGMGQATEYKKYLKGLKEASSSKTKKTYSSMEEMRKAKGFKPGETPSEFNKRRMALAAGKKALKATTLGKIALGVGAAGVAAQQYLKSKMKKDKKMGGGMMKKYNKGGGADMGGKRDFDKITERTKTYALAQSKKNKDRLTERDIDNAKRAIQSAKAKRAAQGFLPSDPMPKKMGGGMIGASQKPGYSKGTMVKARGCKLGRTRPTKIT